jgi:hypothetical protein
MGGKRKNLEAEGIHWVSSIISRHRLQGWDEIISKYEI